MRPRGSGVPVGVAGRRQGAAAGGIFGVRMGSDHDVYQDSSFGIPAIYLNDWPDRYIHTNLDTAANIDPTKLKTAALIGAASGYFLAQMSEGNLPASSAAG